MQWLTFSVHSARILRSNHIEGLRNGPCATLSLTRRFPKKKMFVKICRNAVVDVFCSFSKDLTIESHWGLKKRALCHTLSYMPLPKKKKCLWKFVVMQWLTFSVHSARILRSNHIEGLRKRALCHTLSYTAASQEKKCLWKFVVMQWLTFVCSFSKDLTIESHWGLKKRALCHTLSYMPLPKKKNVCENLS